MPNKEPTQEEWIAAMAITSPYSHYLTHLHAYSPTIDENADYAIFWFENPVSGIAFQSCIGIYIDGVFDTSIMEWENATNCDRLLRYLFGEQEIKEYIGAEEGLARFAELIPAQEAAFYVAQELEAEPEYQKEQ